MSRYRDLTGQRFGRLIAVRYITGSKYKKGKWVCVCDCRKVTTVYADNLKSGHTTSCGCLQAEVRGRANRTHGHTTGGRPSPEFVSWCQMRQRCYNPRSTVFRFYGGRGIAVCARWRDSFENFLSDMGEKPEPKTEYSLDRTDPDGPYHPANCRWAKVEEQANNRRSNRFVSYAGETRTIAEWAALVDVKQSTLRERLRRGWPIDRALYAPKFERLGNATEPLGRPESDANAPTHTNTHAGTQTPHSARQAAPCMEVLPCG